MSRLNKKYLQILILATVTVLIFAGTLDGKKVCASKDPLDLALASRLNLVQTIFYNENSKFTDSLQQVKQTMRDKQSEYYIWERHCCMNQTVVGSVGESE
jgi:hypothetical protein